MKAVSKRRGGPFAASFHGCMIVCTAGLWIPVWLWARSGRKTVTITRD